MARCASGTCPPAPAWPPAPTPARSFSAPCAACAGCRQTASVLQEAARDVLTMAALGPRAALAARAPAVSLPTPCCWWQATTAACRPGRCRCRCCRRPPVRLAAPLRPHRPLVLAAPRQLPAAWLPALRQRTAARTASPRSAWTSGPPAGPASCGRGTARATWPCGTCLQCLQLPAARGQRQQARLRVFHRHGPPAAVRLTRTLRSASWQHPQCLPWCWRPLPLPAVQLPHSACCCGVQQAPP